MAYTSVIPVRRLDRAVKYVMNKEKTTAVSLQDALDYAANRDKTEQSCFESSYACTLETAFSDMRQTKERWHKLGGVQGYHLVQSFAAGEVTPELAHWIAKELADRVLGGRYEYVIGTHLNTGHIHSHIVWNSVSCVDGKKYRSNYKCYVTEIRAVSDELCQKYKLSVIDTENSNHVAKPYAEWLAEKNGQPTWRTAIRQDVDDAIQQSLTWRQFLSVLERNGYEVRMGRKYPVLRPPGKERFVRFKTLGKRYTPEAIQTRILYPRSYRPYVENPKTHQWYCRHCGMWSNPIRPEELSQQLREKLFWICRHNERICYPQGASNIHSIESSRLSHEINTLLASPEPDAESIVRKILHRAELQFTCCSAGDADPATLQIKRACNELEPTDTFPLKLYAEIVSNVILYRDTHIEIKLRNGQIL